MKFAGGRALFFIPLFLLGIGFGREAVAEVTGGDQVQRQFDEIKTRLASIESQQQSILTQKDKILEQIDQVRIWVRHSGG